MSFLAFFLPHCNYNEYMYKVTKWEEVKIIDNTKCSITCKYFPYTLAFLAAPVSSDASIKTVYLTLKFKCEVFCSVIWVPQKLKKPPSFLLNKMPKIRYKNY